MFVCHRCTAKTLDITKVLELVPDDDNDEQSLQILACGSCHAQFVGLYEESRRGSLDSEAWNHDAWDMPAEAIAAAIDACPTPRDRGCTCASHRAYNAGAFRSQLRGDWFRLRR